MPKFSIRKVSAVLLIIDLVLLQYGLRYHDDRRKCRSLLEYGRWTQSPDRQHSHNTWNPTSCVLHMFDADSLRTCLEYTPIHFVGDSTARELFWAIAAILDPNKASNLSAHTDKHSDVAFPIDVTLQFFWDPFLNRTVLTEGPHVLAAGLWYLKDLDGEFECARSKLRAIDNHMQTLNVGREHHTNDTRGIFIPIRSPVYEWLDEARSKYMTPLNIYNFNNDIESLSMAFIEIAWSTVQMTAGHPQTFMEDGIHYTPEIARLQANLLLNRICNPILTEHGHILKSSCCIDYHRNRTQVLMIAVCSGACILWLLWAIAVGLAMRSRGENKNTGTNEQSHDHLRTSKAAGAIGAVLLYCFTADRSVLFDKTNKVVNVNMFVALVACCYVVGLRTIRKTSQSALSGQASFLSRAQTEEWKGWMQAIILLYHYFGMSQVLWVYKIVRVLVGAYLFLTGYGHAMYFERTADYSLRRVANILVRLNLLS